MTKAKKTDRRRIVFGKYNGRCAYCGQEITIDKFQIDHIHPKHLSHLENMNNDRLENLNPSCQKCNNYKHGMRLDVFRKELSLQVKRLMKNAQFNRALRFEQIEITEKPIVFYFEMGNNVETKAQDI